MRSLIVLSFISSAWATCPAGWRELPGETCYYFNKQTLTFPQVKVACHAVGGVPVKITDAYINSAVQQTAEYDLKALKIWIGVEQNVDSHKWVYADDSQTPIKYSKWSSGQPNQTNYCAVMDTTTGQWKSNTCSDALPYFCTQPIQTAASSTPAPVTVVPVGKCSAGWQQFGSNCYYLHNFTTLQDGVHWDLYNFTDAEAACEKMGSKLASIHSSAENDFIYNLVSSRAANVNEPAYGHPCDYAPAWIGMMHTPNPNGTHWVDNTPVDFCDYRDGCIIAEMYNCGFLVHNDPTCFPTTVKAWFWWVIRAHYARFVCKKAATQIGDW